MHCGNKAELAHREYEQFTHYVHSALQREARGPQSSTYRGFSAVATGCLAFRKLALDYEVDFDRINETVDQANVIGKNRGP